MIHKYRLVSIWLLSLLIVFMVTRATTPIETVKTVKYITLTETEYITIYPEEVEEVEEIIEEAIQISLGEYRVSAYCPCEICCGKWADGYTFTGEKAVEGVTIATYPDDIPLGTEIEIEGVGTRIAQDIGGSIYENRIDLMFSTHQQAKEWGIQYLEVWEVE